MNRPLPNIYWRKYTIWKFNVHDVHNLIMRFSTRLRAIQCMHTFRALLWVNSGRFYTYPSGLHHCHRCIFVIVPLSSSARSNSDQYGLTDDVNSLGTRFSNISKIPQSVNCMYISYGMHVIMIYHIPHLKLYCGKTLDLMLIRLVFVDTLSHGDGIEGPISHPGHVFRP